MPRRLLLEGDDLAELLERVRAELPGAAVVRAERVRSGGVAGLFARERYELTVDVPDGVPAAAPRALSARFPAATAGSAVASAPAEPAAPARSTGGLEALLAAADAADGVGPLAWLPPPADAAPAPAGFAAALERARVQGDGDRPGVAAGGAPAPEVGAATAAEARADVPAAAGARADTPADDRPAGPPSWADADFRPLVPPVVATARVVADPAPDDSAAEAEVEPEPSAGSAAAPAPDLEREPAPAPAVVPEPAPAAPAAPAPARTAVVERALAALDAAAAGTRAVDPPAAQAPARPAPASAEATAAGEPGLRERLTAVGVPADLLAAGGADEAAPGDADPDAGPLTWPRFLRRLPAPPAPVRAAGAVTAVVGPAQDALAVAALLADRLGVPPAGLARYGPVPAGAAAPERWLATTTDAATWRAEVGAAPHPGVLAVCLPARASADPAAASGTAAVLRAARPGSVWATVDARFSAADARRALDVARAVGSVDALAARGVADAAQPGALLGLGVPVAWLDGVPAARVAWAAALTAIDTAGDWWE
ncbi:hypothetical protein [Puerhibacterium sp. TATVAM-FAB25]|uniref:hypothetical protein n=1 Tax=Puerhibacterium sp. TATVAM-FAB25 TaxID=3093699 RepID=UPI00397AD687